ncbi:MAG TPA: sensor histidine kinase KdpD [Rhodospirillaceae bacterium]|nr:sensor histidine kinase KdpD [Rhodospirillaceae bacterium]
MTQDTRPNPDQLLNQIKNDEKKAKHGRLKIFFGSCAGVGKTYAMLAAAQEQIKQGVDVVVGIVETHGRPQTEKLLQDIPMLTPSALTYRGVTLYELDLEKALERKPATILVDELAHTNAPGSRHPKRWNDVLELLENGINVFTTLNVQHIESLSDIVAGATGVWVKETIPDSVFDMAEDVVLVDIDPDDLRIRLREGNVYIAPNVSARAADNFFKIDNLNSLREIALRRMAERVDAEREASHTDTTGHATVTDRLLVVIDTDYDSLKLIRSAKRLAVALKAPWTALHIESGDPSTPKNRAKRHAAEIMERMVDRLGGSMETLRGDDRVDEILTYARAHGITKILAGKTETNPVRNFFKNREISHIIQGSNTIDVLVITIGTAQTEAVALTSPLTTLRPLNYLLALLIVIGFTLPGVTMPFVLTTTDQALLYLTGCVLVAERMGLGPALFYALLAASFFNIFFSHLSLMQTIDGRSALITFVVMLTTGYAIATQAAKLRDQARSARKKEESTRALYDLTRKLTGSRGRQPVTQIVAEYLTKAHAVGVTVWMTNAEGHPAVILGDLPQETYYKDFGALQWCFENNHNAGRGTTTMPSAAGFYLPLTTGDETIGVMGVYPYDNSRLFTHDDIASMETLAGLLASALLRVRAGEIAAQAIVDAENKKLREQLLTSFTHDFRKPLEAISGTVANLMRHDNPVDPVAMQAVASTIHHETKQLTRTVDHLLQAGKLEHGAIEPQRSPSSIHERIEKAAARVESTLGEHILIKKIDNNLPDVLIDPSMIEQLIGNLLDNAARFSPPQSTITIQAKRQGDVMLVTIDDEGAGLPKGFEDKIFDKFCSIAPSAQSKGTGLGLTIAAGIARLHHGHLWAENRLEGGARFSFTLPLA